MRVRKEGDGRKESFKGQAKKLKGLSSDVKALFKSNDLRGKKSVFVKGPVQKWHSKFSALYQVCNFKKHGRYILSCGVFTVTPI